MNSNIDCIKISKIFTLKGWSEKRLITILRTYLQHTASQRIIHSNIINVLSPRFSLLFSLLFWNDALVLLELHCKTLLPSKFVAEKIFSSIKWKSTVLAWSATNSQIFKFSLAWNSWPLQPGTSHVICLMYSLPVCQIGSNAIFHAIISEIGPHGPTFPGAVTKESRHGSL